MKKLIYIFGLILIFSCASIQAQNYKTHKVKQGETIESISKKYNVTPYDIYSLNPDAKKGLKRNTVLIIPKSIIVKSSATISKELVGFKEHKVKRKETLYSISKKFDIEEEDIKKHNSFLYANNLRKGDRLKIPVYKSVLIVSEPVEDSTKSYTVLPKEGKWRIAYKFGITVTELETLNPDMNEVLNEGEVINVPNIKQTEEKKIDDQYSYYKVLPKEGFFRLELKLGLEQNELETLNPELKEGGLKDGMVLKIPYNSEYQNNTSDFESVDLTKNINYGEQKHIVIMLPFKLHKVDFDSIAEVKKQINKDPFLNRSLDFYSGVVVALDSLEKLGLTIKVDVYDTRNLSSEISKVLNNNNFKDVDAVIGPFMPKNIERVAAELKQYNTPVISPITKNVTLSANVFQSRPSEDLLMNKIVNYVKNDTTVNQIIIISDYEHTKVSNALKRNFPAAPQVYSRKNKEGIDSHFILEEDILSKLKPGKNLVFLETRNSGFVSNVSSKLNSLISENIQIILATTSMNNAFEDDEVSNYHLSNLQFQFPSIAKTYNEDDKNSFVKKYVTRFGVTPNKVAVRGFDITMDVLLRIVNYKDLYESVTEAPLTEYVENKFAYKKKLFGGYYNDTVYLVKYQDLKIVEIEASN